MDYLQVAFDVQNNGSVRFHDKTNNKWYEAPVSELGSGHKIAIVYQAQLQAESGTYTLADNHVYLLVCGHPFYGGCAAIVAGWSAGNERIKWILESAFVTAVITNTRDLTVTVGTGASFWVRIIDFGTN